jgi:hypothetical protein
MDSYGFDLELNKSDLTETGLGALVQELRCNSTCETFAGTSWYFANSIV